MKKYSLYLLLIITILGACRKEEGSLDVDLTKYNADTYVPDPAIDKWLNDSLTIPYNIQTVYRFERNLTDPIRNISPIELDRVVPIMQAVRNIFLKPYENVAGATFIKTLTPKQFVLYGSPSYNDNGSIILGTADGGRRVVLYELNSMNFSSGADVRRKIRTIHHEFTHILTQNVAIPPAFEVISKADYTTDWTGSGNTSALAKELGFISQYSRSSYEEDFAEMIAHLLVEGQVWFNNYVATTNAKAAADLRAKEKEVKDYYQIYFNIDFNDLQAEVQKALKGLYGVVDPADVTQTFPFWLSNNRVSTLTVDPSAAYYTTYGSSPAFNTVWNNFKAQAAVSPGFVINPLRLEFRFTDASNLVLRVPFRVGTAATVYSGDFNFKFTVNPTTGDVIFTKSLPEGTGTTYNNGALFKAAFESTLLPYLTNNIFVASYLPVGITPTNPLYRTYAGFSVKAASTNYFYGPIVLK